TYGYEPIRFFMLSAHYRSPLNYSKESLIQAQAALQRLRTAMEHMEFLSKSGAEGAMTEAERAFAGTFERYRARFDEAMDDDLNTADAIGVLFEMVRAVNTNLEGTPTRAFAAACRDMVSELNGVLGLLGGETRDDGLDAQVEALITARGEAKKAKDWTEADRIRDQLKDMGIELKDTPQGVQWKRTL
ncbi:MAG: cysteine--tRNA ligase, partial [Clostridiales bacterium]|nr:cysteine--tRNA ligase [Clostridiales bacterium]